MKMLAQATSAFETRRFVTEAGRRGEKSPGGRRFLVSIFIVFTRELPSLSEAAIDCRHEPVEVDDRRRIMDWPGQIADGGREPFPGSDFRQVYVMLRDVLYVLIEFFCSRNAFSPPLPSLAELANEPGFHHLGQQRIAQQHDG